MRDEIQAPASAHPPRMSLEFYPQILDGGLGLLGTPKWEKPQHFPLFNGLIYDAFWSPRGYWAGPGGLGELGPGGLKGTGKHKVDFAQFGLLGPAPFGISGAKLEPPTV